MVIGLRSEAMCEETHRGFESLLFQVEQCYVSDSVLRSTSV